MATKQPLFRRVLVRFKGSNPVRRRWGWQRIPAWRTLIVEEMNWALRNEPQIHYLQARPFRPTAIAARRLPISADCSATTTMLYYAAGRPDPNGNKYNGSGYTGTLRKHTPQLKRVSQCRVGDFIVYGSGTGTHVVVVYQAGLNPKVWSHGQEAGPIITRHSDQKRVHGSICTFHNGDAL